MDEYKAIMAGELPEMEKLKAGFTWVTDQILAHTAQEIELLRALGDGEALVKEQIKRSTVEHVRGIFEMCYRDAARGGGAQ